MPSGYRAGGLSKGNLFDTNIKATSIDEDIFTDQEVLSSVADSDLVWAEADVHGGHGGLGIESSITGVATWRGGGGGGGAWQGSEGGCGGNRGGQWNVSQATKAGGGDGTGLNTEPTTSGTNGKVNTGGGGGGVSGYATPFNSGPGGSGVVIIRYPNTRTVSSVSGGLTTSTLNGTHSSSKYTVFSAGTGTFVFT